MSLIPDMQLWIGQVALLCGLGPFSVLLSWAFTKLASGIVPRLRR